MNDNIQTSYPHVINLISIIVIEHDSKEIYAIQYRIYKMNRSKNCATRKKKSVKRVHFYSTMKRIRFSADDSC